MQDFGDAVETGRANVEAVELTRRHCSHARIELVNGNSMVGSMLGLPMGLLEVRCEHAPPPRRQGHLALELAITFYEANCTACPYRESTGDLPNLATVAAGRAAEQASASAAAQHAADERAKRHRVRRERRYQVLAGEGHVVRDLGDAIDRIDGPDPRVDAHTADEERDARQVLDAARGAPELFRPVLVDSLLELAKDAMDATALQALEALVRAGQCAPRRALSAALSVLTRARSIDAGRLVALLQPDLRPRDLPHVLDQLIALASGEDDDIWRLPSSPDGLIAASQVDLPAVTTRIIEHLTSDDERIREAGADAARVLLTGDSTRVVALGSPLATSVRGPERGYAGYPHPSSAALQALAEGWRGEPELTRRIVEDAAAGARQEVKDQLSRVPWFLQRFREPWDASLPATLEAVSFVVRRATGDWGDEAADRSAEHLRSLVRDVPNAVAGHVDELLGAILALCAPERDADILATHVGPLPLAALERETVRIRRDARRRRLAESVGGCASVAPAAVLGSVQALFSATTGDDDHDRSVRTTMLDILEAAVSPATLRDILPVTYTALLHADQAVRSAGIDVWTACARTGAALPAELAELSVPLLEDAYVIVHRRMLTRIPQLRLPAALAPRLLPLVARWVGAYAEAPQYEPRVLESALSALRFLARSLDDERQRMAWCAFALRYVDRCAPHDRERLLTSWWPEEVLRRPEWAQAALATAAAPELADYYNRRHEPLFEALMDRPQLLAGVVLADIEPLSTIHGAAHPWRALEPVELLQAAGRWADAATIANAVEARQPVGEEGDAGRRLAATVARAAELAQAACEGPTAAGDLWSLVGSVRSAVDDLEASFGDGVHGGQLRSTLDGVMASATAALLLFASTVSDPTAAAEELDGAAQALLGVPSAHAAGTQRGWIGRAWQIAALLLRYDAAVRAVDAGARAFVDAARRRAELLGSELTAADRALVPDGLIAFLSAVGDVADPGAAQIAWQRLGSTPPPLSLVGTSLLPRDFGLPHQVAQPEEAPRAVCVATMRGVPVIDVLVLRRGELYQLGITVRLLSTPEWATTCIVEPVTLLGRDALALPLYEFPLSDGAADDFGITLRGEGPLHCAVEQPILGPALDCPIQVRLVGSGKEQAVELSGFRRLCLRPFDPGRDALTEHEQTDSRLLAMFGALDSPDFDTDDARAFCRLFAACVRAAQIIMFEKTFMRGAKVSETEFHNELERLLRADAELGGRITRRDAVGGGFDDLLHDDIIAELKVSRGAAMTVADCVRYLGQPTQYAAGRGSQLSVLVVFDHGRKEAPPGVIENYIDWLKPSLHGLEDARYPSLVGVLIVNTNLPVPSAWSRGRVGGRLVVADRGEVAR